MRDDAAARAAALLAAHPLELPFGDAVAAAGAALDIDPLATGLMELYRTTRSRPAFELLVELMGPKLLARIRGRVRQYGVGVDPEELVQDAWINVYRYPDRFEARRPAAFRAWASTIVDNALRRNLRRRRQGPDISLRPLEILEQAPDTGQRSPGEQAAQREDCRNAIRTYLVFLCLYLEAYRQLGDRERRVLHAVEVEGRRYAELGLRLGMRPEALKMVVFRARRRILDRLVRWLPAGAVEAPRRADVAAAAAG